MKLLITYLTGVEREYTFEIFVSLLSKSKRLGDWKLYVASHDQNLDFYRKIVETTGINAEYFSVARDSRNYLEKMRRAIVSAKEQSIPYLMKCDNDVFFSAETLDYMIENLDELKKGTHLTLGPTLTTGVPSIEYFLNDYCTEQEKDKLQALFLKTDMYSFGGIDYTPLNKYTTQATSWDAESFFKAVKEFPHYYKGVHPVRFDYYIQKSINNLILLRDDIFKGGRDMSLISDTRSPYLCNSCYCVSVDTYEKILADRTHFVDDYDEVPLNSYAQRNGLGHLFIRNGFGVHMYYNWMAGHRDFEREFCHKFKKYVLTL